MRIDGDLPIIMDDGVVLRADVYRPVKEGKHPVILTYGPYAKGLPFEFGYKDQWENMTGNFPEIKAGTTNKYQCWEVVDPEKWVPEGYAIVRVDSRGAGRSPGYRIALTLQVKDFERPGDTGHLGTEERPMRGSGPFTHTNPMDRPAEIFGNMHTVFGGANKGSYLLLPIIPSKA